MTFRYTLTQNDFLQYQLFAASKSERIKQQRRKSWLIYSIAFLFLGFMFYQSGNNFLTYYFLIIGLVFFCFFPHYQKWYYKNHYQKFIAETYKNRFGNTVNINFTEDYIETKDTTGESRINLTEIENVSETSNYFYIKTRSGEHLVIPKLELDNVDIVREQLKTLCLNLTIDFVDDLSWEWK